MAEDYAALLAQLVERIGDNQGPRAGHDEITSGEIVQSLSEVEGDELVLPPTYRQGYERRLARDPKAAEEYLRKYGRRRGYLYPAQLAKTKPQIDQERHKALVTFVETRRKMLEINSQPLKRRV